MTLPDERYNAVIWARRFLQELSFDYKKFPRIPKTVRNQAQSILKHYPNDWDMSRTAEHVPEVFQEQMEAVSRLFQSYEQKKTMNRSYSTGKHNNIVYFVGVEVEKTPAFGQKTLFVTGLQPITEIEEHAVSNNCKHIFFGANHSFGQDSRTEQWVSMIEYFLHKNYLCSLDIPVNLLESFVKTNLNTFENFIPQIRMPVAHIKKWNKNTMLKIDDIGFDKTNPGIWTTSLNKLTTNETFTDWKSYQDDKVIK